MIVSHPNPVFLEYKFAQPTINYSMYSKFCKTHNYPKFRRKSVVLRQPGSWSRKYKPARKPSMAVKFWIKVQNFRTWDKYHKVYLYQAIKKFQQPHVYCWLVTSNTDLPVLCYEICT